jgi:hypothetical protein
MQDPFDTNLAKNSEALPGWIAHIPYAGLLAAISTLQIPANRHYFHPNCRA